MAEINILSPHVADMIAAGEVVERPASVIKELMENSFDAGARNISVEIRGGGATYICVSDDGRGMAPEDAGVAFLRHATSKLHDESGLEAIQTMGFRGEALAAISAVSEIELRTRRRGDREGTRMTLAAGDIQDMECAGCPEGTVMTVKNLFYNTPARLKFLKSDRSEAGACISAALRCALGRPEISVRFLRDGREEFFSPGDGRADSCIYSLLGRDAAKDMLPCDSSGDGLSLRGFVSSPAAGRGNRSGQFFFCNGRYIKSLLLQAAVEQAYKNSLLTGRYPACVLYLELGFSAVDVNVHPAKTEVKFSQEKAVFDLVYQAVRLALMGEDRLAAPQSAVAPPQGGSFSEPPRAKAAPRADFFRSMSAGAYRESGVSRPASSKTGEASEAFSPTATLRAPATGYQTRMEMPGSVAFSTSVPKKQDGASLSAAFTGKTVENPVQNVESTAVAHHKIVGEALKTYIIVELEEELLLIDKHAAHERMIFDGLKACQGEIMSQSLISPVTLRLGDGDCELLEKNAELLSSLGFELEPFGEGDYILRALPADVLPADATAAVEEICDKLRLGGALDAGSVRDEILHTVACKAAIKRGYDSSPQELERIATEVLSGRVKYCPHGRPVSVAVTQRELDKLFKRIV